MNIFKKIFLNKKNKIYNFTKESLPALNPPKSSNYDEYVKRCLEPEFKEDIEKRTFRDNSDFLKVLEPLNARNYSEAIENAKK